MSNRKRTRPPSRTDAITRALVKGARCDSCGSTNSLQKWDRQTQTWVISPLHRETCATRAVNGRTASPHQVSETSVAAARAQGFQVAYVPHGDGSGGVVVDGEAVLS